MASTQSSLPVDGYETMEFCCSDERTEIKTSWTNINHEGRFFGPSSFWVRLNLFSGFMVFSCVNVLKFLFLSCFFLLQVNMLYQIVLWFEHRNGELVVPGFLKRIKRGLENGVAGKKAKERCLLCCVVLFALVLFCVLSTLVILIWFNPLGRNKFVYLLWSCYFSKE